MIGKRQVGFTYIGLLILVAAAGAGLAAYAETASHAAQREKEAEWGLAEAPGGGVMGLQPLRRGADPDRELRLQKTTAAYGFKIRSSSALPIACVRFTTFSLRRIFCTWFFTVSGLILRIAPISKLDLPR